MNSHDALLVAAALADRLDAPFTNERDIIHSVYLINAIAVALKRDFPSYDWDTLVFGNNSWCLSTTKEKIGKELKWP